MLRFLGLFLAVVIAKGAVTLIVAWLTHRPRASWLYVAFFVNTVILSCLMLVIREFSDHGLTLYGVVFTLLMVWLSSGAAGRGTSAFQIIKQNRVT